MRRAAKSIRRRAAGHRDVLEFIPKFAVRPHDLLQYLNQHRPQVVHFSGHGSPTEEIILLDVGGAPKPVSKAAIKQLFTGLKDNIRVVVLNACFSRPQAEAITEVIDCAVGMKKAIGDKAAIVFAASFYSAIGLGRSVQEAFEQGRAALMLEGIAEENWPELLVRQGVNPNTIFLVSQSASDKQDQREELKERLDVERRQKGGEFTGNDVFISCKNLDEHGVQTRDAEIAAEVYDF